MGYTTPHVVKHMAYGFSAIENSEQLIHCLFSSLLCMIPIHFGAARYYNIVLTPYLPFPYTLSESMDSRPYPLYVPQPHCTRVWFLNTYQGRNSTNLHPKECRCYLVHLSCFPTTIIMIIITLGVFICIDRNESPRFLILVPC